MSAQSRHLLAIDPEPPPDDYDEDDQEDEDQEDEEDEEDDDDGETWSVGACPFGCTQI